MKRKLILYVLILTLLICSIGTVYADPATPTNTATTQSVVGLADDRAQSLATDIKKTLAEIVGAMENNQTATGGAGMSITDAASKEDNTTSFTKLIIAQLKLYELLYRNGINSSLVAPVTTQTLKSDTTLGSLTDIITSYNILNKFTVDQLSGLDKTKPLYTAVSSAVLDLSTLTANTITAAKPKMLTGSDGIISTIQVQINSHTSNSLSKYMEYLNDGSDSSSTSTLKSNTVVNSTKQLLVIMNEWGTDLPDIENSTSSMILSSIGSINSPWIVGLVDLVKVTDNGGDTTKGSGEIVTDPTLATSAIGRLGSSLFSVKRASHADDVVDKPATGTSSWTVDESVRSIEEYVQNDKGPAAKDTFLAMFAATAVYTPFISKVGDKDYLEAYKSLFNDQPVALKDDDEKVTFPTSNTGPLDVLSMVQNLKKPLYYFTDTSSLGASTLYGHSTLDVQGNSQLLTVNDLLKAIKNKTEIAAVTRNGVAKRDGDTWSFYNYSINDNGDTVNTAEAQGASAAEKAKTSTGEPILNKVSADSDTNAGNTTTRVLFEMSFNNKKPGAPLVTGLIMYNIYQDTMLKNKLEARAGEVIYIDAIGNVVLNDGTIVLPAAANPIYWAQPIAYDNQAINNILGAVSPLNTVLYKPDNHELWYYNPFTVAVMDTYPIIFQSGTAPSTVNNKKDKAKYLFSAKDSEVTNFDVDIRKISDAFDIEAYSRSTSVQLYNAFKLDGVPEVKTDIMQHLTQNISTPDEDGAADRGWWFRKYNNSPIQFGNLLTASGDSIFPYLEQSLADAVAAESFSTEEKEYRSAIYIAKNMYSYILGEIGNSSEYTTAASGTSLGGSNISTLREGFLFNNVTMPNLTGLVSGVEFDKSIQKTTLLSQGGDTKLPERWLIGFSKWVIKTSGDTKNILAISNSDEVSALRLIYISITNYGFYFLFVLLIIFLLIFMRSSDFAATLIKGGTIIVMLFVALFLVPVVIPAMTGYLTEPLTRTLTTKALLQQLEQTTKVNTVSTAGQSDVSVKLYNMSITQAADMSKSQRGTSEDFLLSKYAVNDSLGLYAQGTDLRLDLLSFWRSDPLVIGMAGDVNDPNTTTYDVPQIYHSIHSKSDYIKDNTSVKSEYDFNRELVDYYMPFNLIEDGLIDTLNRYLVYYKPMQSIVKYPDGLTKTSYIINTYTRSLAFLSTDPSISKLLATATEANELESLGITELEATVVNEKFYPYGDVLNLQPWVETEFTDLDVNHANSIWGQSMVKSGYYSPEDGYEKRLKLANKVNREVSDVLIRLKDLNGQVSDENLIKLVSMYGTFIWNQEISYMNHNAYPKTVSLNEMSGEDLLSATVLMNSTRYLFYDADLASNVYAEKGVLGIIALDVAAISLMLYSLIVSWLLPFLLAVLIVYLSILVISGKSIMPAITLAFKAVLLLLGMNIALVSVLVTYDIYSSASSLFLMAVLLLVVDVLSVLVFKHFVIKKKDKVNDSWQHKQMNSIGFHSDSYVDNSRYAYTDSDSYNDYGDLRRRGYENSDYGYDDRESSGEIRYRNSHLEESDEVILSGRRRRNRYD